MDLKLLNEILSINNYDVAEAKNGKQALEKISKQKIDLVLLDILMPDIYGFEVCREIKKNKIHKNIPVIMITGLESKQDRNKGTDAGAEDFITKPIKRDELLNKIKIHLEKKDLRDNLNQGYDSISSLTSFGKDIINSFNPIEFDFESTINKIINQVIRQTADRTDKPKIIIVGRIDETNNWLWYKYESTFKELYKTKLERDIQNSIKIPPKESPKIYYCNESDFEKSEFNSSIKILKSAIPIKLSNFIGYLSTGFCLFAVNYGREVTNYDTSTLNIFVLQSLFLKSLSNQIKETEETIKNTVRILIRASEANDLDSGNHVLRVGEYCAAIARNLKMSDIFIKSIYVQAQMHDVGMIYVPSKILRKTDELTYDEWKTIKKHPLYGASILGNYPRFKIAKNIALTHHENWDGSGYPNNLKGDKIPIEGRIARIADTYDTLRIHRLYKPAFDHNTTYKIITKGDKKLKPEFFDPNVLKSFKEVASQFEEIYEKLKD